MDIDIPGFIRALRESDVIEAYAKLRENNPLSGVCGRICSAPCEKACILKEKSAPIAIRTLERFATDFGRPRNLRRPVNKGKRIRIAIVGSGPCGLTAAWRLARKGYEVIIFEAFDKPGGVLRYGVPEFRLPKRVLDDQIADIKTIGVQIETNFFVGKTASLDELRKDNFSAILLAMGAGIPKLRDIPGANLGGVYYGEEFLMRVNLMKANLFSQYIPSFGIGEEVIVLGAGNTAMDCARAAVRFGRKVTLIFRRPEDEMFVRPEERQYGKEEGVRVESMVRMVEILADSNNFVRGAKCIRLDYASTDKKGKWELVPVPGSEFILPADTVIIAAGHRPNSLIAMQSEGQPSLRLNDDGTIYIDKDTGMSSLPGIFAAGNVTTGPGPLIQAIAAGINISKKIDKYLNVTNQPG